MFSNTTCSSFCVLDPCWYFAVFFMLILYISNKAYLKVSKMQVNVHVQSFRQAQALSQGTEWNGADLGL